uniref:Uncharacterized protein n=1 Tax=Acidianus brierleyi TaxID=41673 RepID=A0A2U9IDJ7_9CREN
MKYIERTHKAINGINLIFTGLIVGFITFLVLIITNNVISLFSSSLDIILFIDFGISFITEFLGYVYLSIGIHDLGEIFNSDLYKRLSIILLFSVFLFPLLSITYAALWIFTKRLIRTR